MQTFRLWKCTTAKIEYARCNHVNEWREREREQCAQTDKSVHSVVSVPFPLR